MIREWFLLPDCQCLRVPDVHRMGVAGCFYERTDMSFCVRGTTWNGVTGVRHLVRDIQESGTRVISVCGTTLFAYPDVGPPYPWGAVNEIAFDVAMPTCPRCIQHVQATQEPNADGEIVLSTGPLAGPWFPPHIHCRFQDESGWTHYSNTPLRPGQGRGLCGVVENPMALPLALQHNSRGACGNCIELGLARSEGHGMAIPGVALVEEEGLVEDEEDSDSVPDLSPYVPATLPSHLLGMWRDRIHVMRPSSLTRSRPLCQSDRIRFEGPFFTGPSSTITCEFCTNLLQRAAESETHPDRMPRRYRTHRIGHIWHMESADHGILCSVRGPVQVSMPRYVSEEDNCSECVNMMRRGLFVPWESAVEGVPTTATLSEPLEDAPLPSRFDRVGDDD